MRKRKISRVYIVGLLSFFVTMAVRFLLKVNLERVLLLP